MKIDIKSDQSLFIELNDFHYYIDDSTNEQIMNCFHETSMGKDIPPIYCNIESKIKYKEIKRKLDMYKKIYSNVQKKYLLLIDYVDNKQVEGCDEAKRLLNYKLTDIN